MRVVVVIMSGRHYSSIVVHADGHVISPIFFCHVDFLQEYRLADIPAPARDVGKTLCGRVFGDAKIRLGGIEHVVHGPVLYLQLCSAVVSFLWRMHHFRYHSPCFP